MPTAIKFGLFDIGTDGNLYTGLNLDTLLLSSLFTGQKSAQKTRTSVLDYLQTIGLSTWPDQRFCLFLERILHPEIQSPERQKQFVSIFGTMLKPDGFRLTQDGQQAGSPVYKIQKTESGVVGSPKYIIFASSGLKPDIVINDAVNMDIMIAKNAGHCVIYDDPPPNGDLTWKILLDWWGKKNMVDPTSEQVRQEFGLRLRSSLQSEPERMIFDTYFKEFKAKLGNNLPALLPQIYLHYDPRNRNERGVPVLVRQRMDFLMILRNTIRIVIEVDGKQHYATKDGYASPQNYAEMVSEDRRIRLLGYEIYRFGGAEFVEPKKARQTLITFFDELFLRHEIYK